MITALDLCFMGREFESCYGKKNQFVILGFRSMQLE